MKRSLVPPLAVFITGVCACGILVTFLVGCGSGGGETVRIPQSMMPRLRQSSPGQTKKVFTLQELATYDGQNGRPAYIAVDGVVYDVSGQPDWPMGTHKPHGTDAVAGKDLTQELNGAPPMMRMYVMMLPVVGILTGQ